MHALILTEGKVLRWKTSVEAPQKAAQKSYIQGYITLSNFLNHFLLIPEVAKPPY